MDNCMEKQSMLMSLEALKISNDLQCLLSRPCVRIWKRRVRLEYEVISLTKFLEENRTLRNCKPRKEKN